MKIKVWMVTTVAVLIVVGAVSTGKILGGFVVSIWPALKLDSPVFALLTLALCFLIGFLGGLS